jgi:hypothetical protein
MLPDAEWYPRTMCVRYFRHETLGQCGISRNSRYVVGNDLTRKARIDPRKPRTFLCQQSSILWLPNTSLFL